MTSRLEQLIGEILELSAAERAEVAEAVLASLHAPGEPGDDGEVAAAWRSEIRRRLEQFRADGHAIPWEQVRVTMRAR